MQALITLSAVDERSRHDGAGFLFRFSTSPVLAHPGAKDDEIPLAFPDFSAALRHHGQRVCLVGDPGSGKSTTLLALARDAAVDRLTDSANPVPVLASLSDWTPGTSVREWAQPQVRGVDPGAYRWLYLLDGLDELERRSGIAGEEAAASGDRLVQCLGAIEHELQDAELVVSCRDASYRDVKDHALWLPTVRLERLSDAQIRDYLLARCEHRLWETVSGDASLRELARTPLLLAFLRSLSVANRRATHRWRTVRFSIAISNGDSRTRMPDPSRRSSTKMTRERCCASSPHGCWLTGAIGDPFIRLKCRTCSKRYRRG